MDRCLRKSRRRKKVSQYSGFDLLSELPDALIIHILSFLEMKDVMNTSMLSKRWKDMWTQVDCLVYHSRFPIGRTKKEYRRKLLQFYSFTDSTLMRCTSPKIRKFCFRGFEVAFEDSTSIHEVLDKPLSKMFDKWLSFVLSKNVEYLKLGKISYSAPDCLFHTPSLVELTIDALDISVSSPVSWSLLRSLSLILINIDDETIANILSGCPMLETITFRGVFGINHLNILSPSVKKLTIFHIEYQDVEVDDFLDINAPWLEELQIEDSFFIPQCKLVDVSSLKKTYFDFVYSCDPSEEAYYDESDGNSYGLWWTDMVNGLVRSVHHVNELSLGPEVIQALAVPNQLSKPCPLFKCKHLMLHSLPIWKNDLYAIACLLKNAPYLETLSMVSSLLRIYTTPYATDHFKNRNLHLNLPKANFPHLKIVKIDYNGLLDHKQPKYFDFELLEYILRNASVLEKLILVAPEDLGECLDYPTYCACEDAPCLSSRLSTYLDGCESLKWELKKGESVFEFSFLHIYDDEAKVPKD